MAGQGAGVTSTHDDIRIPDHKVIGVLGQGGMARVFLARDEAFDRLVAVKVIDSRVSGDVQFQRRFEREAKTAGGLSHPNIVPVHRYGTTEDGRPYLTMAYLDGGSLRDRMRKRGAMSVDEALGITRQIASALLAAHSRSVVHRDLKPDNVLFQGETAYLTDFGIAKLLDAATELTGTGLNPGTVRYFSPEQALEQAVDARTDIYALGILLYEMLTGRQPIEGDTIVQMLMRIANMPPQRLPEDLRGLQPFMDILLAKDPADRLGSCQEVVSIIDAMLRNWTRYADVDRLTDGVVMQASGRALPAADLDADTQLGPLPGIDATDAPTESRRGARAPPPLTANAIVIADRTNLGQEEDLGLTDPSIAAIRPQRIESDPAGNDAHDAKIDAAARAPAIAAAPGGRRRLVPIGVAAAALILTATMLWWQRTDGPLVDAVPAADAPKATPGDVAITSVPAGSTAGQTAPAPIADDAPTARPPAGAARPNQSEQVAGTGTTEATAATTASLEIVVTPGDARITLPELRERYRPGMTLQGQDVLVRIERRGFVPREERLPLQPGRNNIERALVLAGQPAAGPGSAPAASASTDQTGVGREGTPGATSAGNAAAQPTVPRRSPGPIRRPGERFHDALASGEPGPDMVVIPAGSFRMGGTGRDETPVRNVNLRRAFAIGVHEVTFDDYDRFARASGREPPADQGWGRGRRPVINVSWDDARAYTAWLSAQTGQRYRLPSEAEWEYAHRAGSASAYTFGDTLLPARANCDGCGGTGSRRSADVGSFPPNRFGLHDSHGSVWEWVEDCYAPSYAGAPSDGSARSGGSCRERVFRGGSWFFDALSMRSSKRSVFAAGSRSRDLGFRLARDL